MTELTPVQKQRLREQHRRFSSPAFLVQLALIGILLVIPLAFSSFRVIDVVAKIMIFAVFVASYDLLLGYSGLLSLGHSMFFGIGAYCLALVIYHLGPPSWYHILLATGVALTLSISMAVVIAFFSLRVKAIFFAMMTLALAEFADILAIQWYDLTRAEDGVSFKLPGIFSLDWTGTSFLGLEITGRITTYYFILVVSVFLFIGLLKFVRSPVGRVLKAIRDNEPRATALGYRTFRYQVLAIVFGSAMASLTGILFAMWLRYVNPGSVLSMPIMLNVLLMVIIGGLGTMYGSIVGAAFIKIAEAWLPDLQKVAKGLLPHIEVAHRLAERWILYFGILFILVVFFFPKGFVGTAKEIIRRRRGRRMERG
ncbi:MAG: branched-chain amino acid ABC transporter permease [Desulfobacteraceae bacterium]|jgi:branched-chain amino acid transport system permease protein|nr:MAG: branched-chain amino acid ABC transporter permease [Desulfobacteraceae bacterium]